MGLADPESTCLKGGFHGTLGTMAKSTTDTDFRNINDDYESTMQS